MRAEKLDTEIRREQIAEAALNLVANAGLRRLSIAAVAKRVGLVPSGIYRHFPNKEAILAAVLDLLQQRLGDIVRAAQAESEQPLEQLRAVLLRHVRFIREGRAIPRIIFSDEVHADHPGRKERIRQIVGGYVEQLAAMIARGQQLQQVRADVEPHTAAMLFLGMVIPAGIFWQLTDGGFDVTRHAVKSWRLYRQMLVAQATSEAS
jgi:AcrR family transcriptional regulator